jgi:hypothetical protein
MRESIGLIPGVVIHTAFALAVVFWMYATIGVLSAAELEWRQVCTVEKKSDVTVVECLQAKDRRARSRPRAPINQISAGATALGDETDRPAWRCGVLSANSPAARASTTRIIGV